MNASVTRPRPPLHMPAPGRCAPGMTPPEADGAGPAALDTGLPAVSEPIFTASAPASSCVSGGYRRAASAAECRLFRQYRVEHRFRRGQHVFGNRLAVRMQVK